jgi:glyoxylase-like metal-dependent hydrolase (beta-lactamase superfamily II)
MSRTISVAVLLASALVISVVAAQQPPAPPVPPLVREGVTTKISDHVYVIPDGSVPLVPNVGIVVGANATLVVDTGLGPRNAETVLKEVAKVSTNTKLYLVATHFHPEHAGGATAFPASTTFIVSDAEQRDLDQLGAGMMTNFSRISPVHADLLRDVTLRKGDVHFATDYRVDLGGGVVVNLRWVGPTHTRGDTIAFVEPDRILFAGDVVMNRAFLAFGAQSSPAAWQKAFDTLEAMRPARIVPSHGPMGDASLIPEQRAVVTAILAKVRTLKAQGQTVDQAVSVITSEIQAQYPTWTSPARIGAAVRATYAEAR